ncbi:MAG: TerC/Alx family metal homeostasis membrane protein [Myxococcales bacterium]|nr:TerC/Alx family metal homeostasis membrane protein [Myxococcales bacterium]
MIWFWTGFFALVALLLFLDLFVLNKGAKEPTIKSAIGWTAGWVTLGLSFSGFVYLMYEQGWLGATLVHTPGGGGSDAAVMYLSAYLLELALSVDNLFVIALLFKQFRVPRRYQHRVLFWGILGAVVFRLIMLGGGAYLAHRFDWIFYVFGAYLVFQGGKLLFHDDDNPPDFEKGLVVRTLRKFGRIVDGDSNGKVRVIIDGKRAWTTVFVCLISIELADVVFALDSIPAVLSVSQETFVMVTSNIFAILGLRSLYFVLAGAMEEFKYLKIALAILLMLIGAKMFAHSWIHINHLHSLAGIAGILGIGVIASVVSARREHAKQQNEAPVDPAQPEN